MAVDVQCNFTVQKTHRVIRASCPALHRVRERYRSAFSIMAIECEFSNTCRELFWGRVYARSRFSLWKFIVQNSYKRKRTCYTGFRSSNKMSAGFELSVYSRGLFTVRLPSDGTVVRRDRVCHWGWAVARAHQGPHQGSIDRFSYGWLSRGVGAPAARLSVRHPALQLHVATVLITVRLLASGLCTNSSYDSKVNWITIFTNFLHSFN